MLGILFTPLEDSIEVKETQFIIFFIVLRAS